MQGQCQNCKGLFEIQPEWVGQQVKCPYCSQVIVAQAAQVQEPQLNLQQNTVGQPMSDQCQSIQPSCQNTIKGIGSLICGIMSIHGFFEFSNLIFVFSFLFKHPFLSNSMPHLIVTIIVIGLSLLVAIAGLILGWTSKDKKGIILNIIGIVLAFIRLISAVLYRCAMQ